MLKPLEQWICDTCGQLIEKPDDGYVEWLCGYGDKDAKAAGQSFGPKGEFRIVHHAPHSPRQPHRDCYKHTDATGRADIPLTDFLGQSGLSYLLTMLDEGEFFDPENKTPGVRDMRQFMHFVRRLQLPYYEEAHRYFDAAAGDGELEGADPVWLYHPRRLESIAERYAGGE